MPEATFAEKVTRINKRIPRSSFPIPSSTQPTPLPPLAWQESSVMKYRDAETVACTRSIHSDLGCRARSGATKTSCLASKLSATSGLTCSGTGKWFLIDVIICSFCVPGPNFFCSCHRRGANIYFVFVALALALVTVAAGIACQ